LGCCCWPTTGNSWEQGQMALANLLLFSFLYSLCLNSLPSGPIKLKHNAQSHKKTPAIMWDFLGFPTIIHTGTEPLFVACLYRSLSALVCLQLLTNKQWREQHKETCEHLGYQDCQRQADTKSVSAFCLHCPVAERFSTKWIYKPARLALQVEGVSYFWDSAWSRGSTPLRSAGSNAQSSVLYSCQIDKSKPL
jgi:hypothetical protein